MLSFIVYVSYPSSIADIPDCVNSLEWNDSSLYDTGDTSLQMTGVVAMITTIITLFTSLPCIRNAAYQFFMASHIIGWITLLIAV